MTIDQLNRLPEDDAFELLEQCCGAYKWVERLAFARPFEDLNEVLETSDNVWEECDVEDYEEAFSFFPRIGHPEDMEQYRNPEEGFGGYGDKWAAQELKVLEGATPEELARLEKEGAAYEEKFGYPYVVCAPGMSVAEISEDLLRRMANDARGEIEVAAAELHKITQLRLKKMLA